MELVPNGVNVIIGTTDSGKSSFFRSLDLLLRNKIRGWAYKSWFAGPRAKTVVTLTTDMGDTISRVKSTSKNEYIVNGVPYEAVGYSVPEEVQELLPINACNIQPQHQPYFMLQDTPGAVGEAFAEIVGLEIIERITSAAKLTVTQKRSTISALIEEKEILEQRLVILQPVDRLVTLLNDAWELKSEVERTQRSIENISNLIAEANRASENYTQMDRFINDIELPFTAALKALNAVVDFTDPIYLRQLIDKHNNIVTELDGINTRINTLEPMYESITDLVQKAQHTSSQKHDLSFLIRHHNDTLSAIQLYDQKIENTKIEIQQQIDTVGFCPLCGAIRGEHEIVDNGGLAYSCRQSEAENRQLSRNTVEQNTKHTRRSTKPRMPIRTTAR